MKKALTWIAVIAALAALVWVNVALFRGQFLGLSPQVQEAMKSDAILSLEYDEENDWLVVTPTSGAITGLILFPEGRMDVRTYAPIGRMLAAGDLQVIFLSRRLDREFDQTEQDARISAAIAAFPDIEHWVLGGHSWGGRISAVFANQHPGSAEALVLFATRLDAEGDLSTSDLPVLFAYGTLDDENVGLINTTGPLLPPQTVFVPIEGGNRVGFGSYGPMAADVGATITPEEQQAAAAEAVLDFLAGLGLR